MCICESKDLCRVTTTKVHNRTSCGSLVPCISCIMIDQKKFHFLEIPRKVHSLKVGKGESGRIAMSNLKLHSKPWLNAPLTMENTTGSRINSSTPRISWAHPVQPFLDGSGSAMDSL
jgi:hypothetical protein